MQAAALAQALGRLLLGLLLWLALGAVALAADISYDILLDTDNDSATGCTVATPKGYFAGADLLISTQVRTTATGATVVGVAQRSCSGGTWGASQIIDSGSWPVGFGEGLDGTAIIETFAPRALLGQGGPMRAGIVARSGNNADALLGISLTLAPRSGGGDIAPIPTLTPWMLLLLAGAVGLLAARLVRRRGGASAPMLFLVLVSVSSLVWAATISLDGQGDDWAGLQPQAEGVKGDAPPNVDLVALWFTEDGQNAYFRIDADVVLDSDDDTGTLSLGPIADRSIPAGQPWMLRLAADSSTPDAQLSYAKTQGPAAAALDPAPLLKWTPAASDVGTHAFAVQASDGTQQAEAHFNITVTQAENRPPVMAQADAQIGAGATFRRTLSASDPDGDAVTVQLLGGPPAAQLTGDALVWPTTTDDLGEHVFAVSATDAHGATSGARFAVQVLPQAAPAANDDAYEVRQGDALTVPAAEGVLANDYPDDGSLESQKVDDATAPDKGQLDAFGTDGSFVYTAPPTLAAPPPLKMALDWHEDGDKFVTKNPSVADLNGDGIPDVVYAAHNDLLIARSGAEGQPLLWQHTKIQLPASMPLGDGEVSDGAAPYWCSTFLEQDNIPLIADVDDNGAVDVVTTVVCDMDGGVQKKRVIALDGKTGDVKWLSPRLTLGTTDTAMPAHANLSVARLDPNGPPLIFGGQNHYGKGEVGAYGAKCVYLNGGDDPGHTFCRHVFALNGQTGALEQEFYDWTQVSWTGGTPYTAAAPLVADLTGDGRADVLFEGTLWRSDGTVLQQFDGTPELPGAAHFAVADLTGNGQAELLLLSRKGRLHALHMDGTPLWQTPPLSACGSGTKCSLTVADVDGDGTPEILVQGIGSGRQLAVFDTLGRVRWTKQFTRANDDVGLLYNAAQPAVYDLDGDGMPEVIVRVAQTVRVLRGDTGEELDSFATWPEEPDNAGYLGYRKSPIVVGMGPGGEARIVVGNQSGLPGQGGGVRGVWVLKSAHTDHPWMKARKRHGSRIDLDGHVDAASGRVARVPPTPGVAGAANLFGHQRQLETRADLRERARTSFAYQAVAEDGSRSAPATVHIDIVPPNRPPVITSTPPRVASNQVPFVYQVAAHDPDPGDTISYSARIEYGSSTLYGLSGLSIGEDGRLEAEQNGDGMITVRATDSQGAWAEQSFFIEFVNPTVAANNIVTPNLLGQSPKNAMGQLSAAGFNLGSLQEGQDDSVPAGQVMHQSPAGGSAQLKGTAVHLTVSTGPAPRPVPAVVGKPLTQASTLLGAFDVGHVNHVYNDTVARGIVMQQTPAAGTEGTPPGAVDLLVSGGMGLELSLASDVALAGSTLAATARALAPDGAPETLPALNWAVTSLADPHPGPLPAWDGSQVVANSATRGAFRLTATAADGRSARADFGVTAPLAGGDSPMLEYVQMSTALQDMLDLLEQARQAGSDEQARTIVKHAVNRWRQVDRNALRVTSPMTLEDGFLPSPQDLTSAGVTPGPHDALNQQLLRDGIAPLKALTAGLRARGTPLTQLQALTDAFAAKARRVSGIMPSEYGAVLAAPEYALITSHAIPDLIDALMDDLGEGLGLGREQPTYPMLKSVLVDMGITLTVNAAIDQASGTISAAKKYAKDILIQGAWGAAAVAAAQHAREFYGADELVAVVSGASMSFRVFGAPWALIEGMGLERDYPELNTVAMVGPDILYVGGSVVDAVKQAVDDIVAAMGSAAINPYGSAEQTKGALKNLRDAANHVQNLVNHTLFQSSSERPGQCLFHPSPECAQLMFTDGFESVYHYDGPGTGGGLGGLPVPIVFIVRNSVTGQMYIDTPVFLPTTEP